MSLTPSNMLPLGTPAPDFQLPDPRTGETASLAQLRGERGTLVMFICNHCPYVQHVEDQLISLAHDYQPKGVACVAISANDAHAYPQDGPEAMARRAGEKNYPFPYLFDQTQAVARAYQAACTPDFFLFDTQLRCVYRGQLDNARPGNDLPITGRDLRTALEALLAGEPPLQEQRPSVGCNIKWRT